MDLLLISYNTKKPYVCLFRDNRQVAYSEESEYYELTTSNCILPENAISHVIKESDKIDNIVFLGKPLRYIRDLIIRHLYLFPMTPVSFIKDLLHYFENILQVNRILKAISTSDGTMITQKIKSNTKYYISLEEALAQNINAGDETLIVTCLTDTFEGNSFCCFEKENGMIKLKRELNPLNSFSNLLRIYDESGEQVNLNNMIQISDRSCFEFNKRCITVRNNSFAIREKKLSTERNYNEMNEKVLLDTFSRLMKLLKKGNRGIIFISDIKIPSNIIHAHKDITFKHVDIHNRNDLVREYLYKKILAKTMIFK